MITFKEVYMQPQDLKLNYSQRRVLRKIIDNDDPKIAAQRISQSEDARNLVAATKILARHGYVKTEPSTLGPNDEPRTVAMSDTGQQLADEYNVATDQTLVTPAEQQAGAPQAGGEPAPGGMGAGGLGGGELGGMGGEMGGEEMGTEEEPGAEEEPVPGEEEMGGEEEPSVEVGGEEEPPTPEAEELIKKKKQFSSFFMDINDLAKYLKS